jgi:predicted dehydrogenase
MDQRVRIGVVGVGHLGKEHARILAGLPGVDLVGVTDTNAAQAQAVAQKCRTRVFADHQALLKEVDAACIVVPTLYHHAIAGEFLRAGKPVLVEKPLASTVAQAEDLVALSRQHGALLQVGHIERFNPALLDLEKRPLRPKYIEGQRLSGFSGRSLDIGVVMDLMIHDIDVTLALVRSSVVDVQAVGVTIFGAQEDMANARLTFANGCVATLTASRVSNKPVRKMQVVAAEGYVGLDFGQRHATIVQPSARLRAGLDVRQLDLSALGLLREKLFGHYLDIREFDMKEGDQLTMELDHFVSCVRAGTRPKVAGEDGLAAVAVADRILACIRNHQWEGTPDGPTGPATLPLPLGSLLRPEELAA